MSYKLSAFHNAVPPSFFFFILTASVFCLAACEGFAQEFASDSMVLSRAEQAEKPVEDFQEVLLEVEVYQITLHEEYDKGVDWEAILSDFQAVPLEGDFNQLKRTAPTLSVGTIVDVDVPVLIEALSTVGEVEHVQVVKVVAAKDRTTGIAIGPEQTTAGVKDPETVTHSVQFIDIGVKLFVQPGFSNGAFDLNFAPEVSSFVGHIEMGENAVPLVETAKAYAQVKLHRNQAVVFGGLIKEVRMKMTKKLPVLGDIPVFGLAFRQQDKEVLKKEIVIFVKPRKIQ